MRTSAQATPQLKSDVDIRAQRALPIADLVAVQIAVAAGVISALALDRPGWQGAIVGFVVAAAFVVPVRGTNAARSIGVRCGYLLDRRRRAREYGYAEPFDITASDGEQIGFRWDGTTLLSMIRIDANPQALTVLEPGVTVSGEMVPVGALVECLHQFDIELDGIDVVSHGARSYGHTDIAAVYDAVLGPLPAIANRTVWIALRFDPSRCPAAVRRRGGGREGVIHTATTATRRVANRLIEAGLRPSVLTAHGIAAATNQLADGVNLATVEETWESCRDGQFRLSSFAIEPELLTTEGLGLLWTVPSYSTTLCLSLREHETDGLIRVRGLTRFDSEIAAPAALPGLKPLRGLQFSALASTLPVPPPARPIGHWCYGRRDVELRDLAVPASGCGQVIGADEQGRAVALPVFGAQITRVEICGTLHLTQQVVLRALALGARVLVHSRRPQQWRDMVEVVARQDLLWVADFHRRALQAGSDRNYNVEVFDGTPEQSVRSGVTSIVVAPPGTPTSPDADVALELIAMEYDTVKVSTRSGSAIVTMVATDEEMRYLKASADNFD
nr:type VII secretion protein EccE [Mycolicibacterium komanii]